MSEDALLTAQAALDRASAAHPSLDGAALTDATKALCGHRDRLRRGPKPAPASATAELKAVNALISMVHAVHFPIGGVPWALLDEARARVKSLGEARPHG